MDAVPPRIFSAGAVAACRLRHPRIATQRLTRIPGKPKQFTTRSCGRVAEGGGLLNRYTLQRRIEGSNPSGSAILLRAGALRRTSAGVDREAGCPSKLPTPPKQPLRLRRRISEEGLIYALRLFARKRFGAWPSIYWAFG